MRRLRLIQVNPLLGSSWKCPHHTSSQIYLSRVVSNSSNTNRSDENASRYRDQETLERKNSRGSRSLRNTDSQRNSHDARKHSGNLRDWRKTIKGFRTQRISPEEEQGRLSESGITKNWISSREATPRRKKFVSDLRKPQSSLPTTSLDTPVVYYSNKTSGGNPVKVPIQINPQNVKSFNDLQLDPTVLSSLHRSEPHIRSPSEIQKKILALLKSDVSVLVRSNAGSGKSLATVLYMMSHHRSERLSIETEAGHEKTTPYITNLILVPSPQLAAQYYRQIEKLVENIPNVNIHNVVQRLFRSDENDQDEYTEKRFLSNEHQIDLLAKYPGPHILIATPNRILDYLSSSKRALIPLFNLSCVALDELDALYSKELLNLKMLLPVSSESSPGSSKKRNQKQVPTDLLMNHVRSWRDGYMKRGIIDQATKRKATKDSNALVFSPLRIIMNSSVDIPGLDKLPESKPWLQDGGRPILNIGVASSGRGITYTMENGINSYFVTCDPESKKMTDTKFSLKDGDLPSKVNDSSPVKSPSLKDSLSLVIMRYTDAFLHLRASMEVSLGYNNKKSLIVIPDGVPAHDLAKSLQSRGIKCGIAASSSRFGFRSFEDNLDLDPETIFHEVSSDVDVIISQAISIHGIVFPGLSNICVFDWSSIYPKLLYTKLAGLFVRPDESNKSLFIVSMKGNEEKDARTISSSLKLIENLTRKNINEICT